MREVTPPRLNAEIGKLSPDGKTVTMSLWLYNYLFSCVLSNPDQTAVNIAVGASPFTYTNTTGYDLTAIVQGGTVSNLALGRSGVFYTVTGPVDLSPGDSLRVTYTVLPVLTAIPR